MYVMMGDYNKTAGGAKAKGARSTDTVASYVTMGGHEAVGGAKKGTPPVEDPRYSGHASAEGDRYSGYASAVGAGDGSPVHAIPVDDVDVIETRA